MHVSSCFLKLKKREIIGFFSDFKSNASKNVVKRNIDYDYYDHLSSTTIEPEFIYRIHIIGHLRRVNNESMGNEFEEKISPLAQLTKDTSDALVEYMLNGFGLDLAKSNDKFKLSRVDWQRFITQKGDYSIVCLAIAISKEVMVAKGTCVGRMKYSQIVFVNEYPKLDSSGSPVYPEHLTETIEYVDGAIFTKYNYVIIKAFKTLFLKSDGYDKIRPLCRKVSIAEFVNARFSWIFPVLKSDGNVSTLFTVARVLNPATHAECKEVNANNELLCVKLESDFGQCTPDVKQIDPGYLAFYQKAFRLYLIAIHSHGAETCLEAKKRVAFFTRTNVENIQRLTDSAAPPWQSCHQDVMTQFEGH